MQLAFLNSSINTPAANVITRVSHYTFTRVSTLNCLLNARFFHELLYNRKSFPANNKNIMQPRNFSTANDLHYTVLDIQASPERHSLVQQAVELRVFTKHL